MSDNILTLLTKEHTEFTNILEKLQETSEKATKTRNTLFSDLENQLKLHEKFEEEILYPAINENVNKHSETRAQVMEGYQEHHVADLLISEMKKLDSTDEVWNAKLKVLKENIEHHVSEEQDSLFPEAKKLLSDAQLNEMGLQFKEWKNSGDAS